MEPQNYLMITSLKIITAGPPYPCDLHQPQIENIQKKKKKFQEVPKTKTWIYYTLVTIYVAFTLYVQLHSIYFVSGTISNSEMI